MRGLCFFNDLAALSPVCICTRRPLWRPRVVQMYPQCSHIARKRQVYYYRRRVPCPGVGEVTLSLRTRNFREAQHLASVLDLRFLAFIAEPAGMTIADNVRRVLAEELQRTLANSLRKLRATPAGASFYGVDDESWSHGDDLKFAESEVKQQRHEIKHRYLSPSFEEWAESLIEKHGLPASVLPDLAFDLAQVRLQRLEKELEWLQRGPVDVVPLPLAVPELVKSPSVAEAQPPVALEPAKVLPKLSDLLPDFLDVMTDAGEGWRGQTRNQNSATYRMFMEVCGDRHPSQYARADLSTFHTTLRKLPAMYSKSARWRDMRIVQIAALQHAPEVPRLTAKTMKRHFAALGSMFTHFIQHGVVQGVNPAHGFSFPKQGRANTKVDMWQGEELVKLFSSPVWAGSGRWRSKPGPNVIRDDKYWLPILGLFHGARLEELAQLKCTDIKQEAGIWYFDIADGEGQQLKNAQSVRQVPIHPKLLLGGFLEYVEGIKQSGVDRVFPELDARGPDNKMGYTFTKWFTNYRKSIDVYRPGLHFHSFRHGVETQLTRAEVTDEKRRAIIGHEGQGTGQKFYFKGFKLPELYKAIAKIEWPEVEHLFLKGPESTRSA